MTRILVTMGPAIALESTVRQLIEYGVSGFRLPASKLSWEALSTHAAVVSTTAQELGVEVDLFLDLPGVKMQLTNEHAISLAGADRIRLTYGRTDQILGDSADLGLIGVANAPLIEVGDILLIGDGEDALRVETTGIDHCVVVPLTAGTVGRRRGVVVQGKQRPPSDLTDADLGALRLVPDSVFDGVMLSFVETPTITTAAREILREGLRVPDAPPPLVVAKVETAAGVDEVDLISRTADAVLLGRGDLLMNVGELGFHLAVKTIVERVAAAGTPLIIGTQLLTSLADSWLPHRSELSYVCQLAEQGVAGVLLSDETTVGPHPVRTVELLAALINRYGTLSTRRFSPPA